MLRISNLVRATLISAAIGMSMGAAPVVQAAEMGAAHAAAFGGGGFHGGGGGFHGGGFGGGFHGGSGMHAGQFHPHAGGFHPDRDRYGRLRNGLWIDGSGDYPYDDGYYYYCNPTSPYYDMNLCYEYED